LIIGTFLRNRLYFPFTSKDSKPAIKRSEVHWIKTPRRTELGNQTVRIGGQACFFGGVRWEAGTICVGGWRIASKTLWKTDIKTSPIK